MDRPIFVGYNHFITRCNRSDILTMNKIKGYMAHLLFHEANKKTFQYLQAQTSLYIHLTMSNLRTYPQLYALHPGIQLCQVFSDKLGIYQNEVHQSMRQGGIESLDIKQLLELNIAPIPTLTALYREEKKSHQRVQALGVFSRSLFKLLSDMPDESTFRALASSTNVFIG